jgi:CheY-like chemotaxis protein
MARKTILYISDQATGSDSALAALEATGYEVVSTNRSTQAVALEYIMHSVAAVVLHHRSGEQTGSDVARTMRAICPDVPIILLCCDQIEPLPTCADACVSTCQPLDKFISVLRSLLTAKRSPVHSAQCTDHLEGQSEKPSTQRMRPGETQGVEPQGPTAGWAPIEKNKASDFIAYPTNKVVGFIDDPGDAQAALSDLRAAGFTADEIEVLVGEEGAQRIDVDGGEHGVLAHMVRSILKALGDYEIPHAKRHEQELLAGHFGIGVTAKQEDRRKKARGILKSHNGHFINFYGTWTMENLEP